MLIFPQSGWKLTLMLLCLCSVIRHCTLHSIHRRRKSTLLQSYNQSGRLLLTGTCNINGFYDGNVIEGSDDIDVNLQKIAGKLQD